MRTILALVLIAWVAGCEKNVREVRAVPAATPVPAAALAAAQPIR
jgi:hypothetical protein